ncbi:MAG TPA: substrate-binding domain-containing protein, partial [Opitutus sp.]|nr:substrate-binding domain-containing protein [Opitutus sp.]
MKSGLAAGFFCALAVAAGEPVRAGEIRVAGSDLLGPAFADALRAFTGRSEQSLALALEGSRSALAQLRENKADVALVMVPPGQRLPEDGFRSFALAYQVACVLVPANSPLTQITLTDLAGIYGASASPARVRWGELGLTGDWSMRAIEPQAMATGAGLSLEILHELVPASGRLRETVVQHPSTAALLR